MSERDLTAPVRTSSVGIRHQNAGMFPFDAWEFDSPDQTAPNLTLKDPWDLELERGYLYLGKVGDDDDGYLYLASDAYLHWDESGDNFEFSKQVQILGGSDVDLTAESGYLLIGDPTGAHVAVDDNEIQAKSDGTTAAVLYLQNEGSNLEIGAAVTKLTNGVLWIQEDDSEYIILDSYYADNYSVVRTKSTLYFRINDGGYTHYFNSSGIVGCEGIKVYSSDPMTFESQDGDDVMRFNTDGFYFINNQIKTTCNVWSLGGRSASDANRLVYKDNGGTRRRISYTAVLW